MNVQNKNNSSYVIIGIALLSSLVWRVSPSEMEGRPPFMCSDFPYRQYGTHFPYQAINYFQLSSNLFYSPHKHSIFQIHMSKYFVDKLMFVCLRQSFPPTFTINIVREFNNLEFNYIAFNAISSIKLIIQIIKIEITKPTILIGITH